MSISPELFFAILSMDAYNRGYGAGMNDVDGDDLDGLGLGGSIGPASIKTLDELGVSQTDYAACQTASFYAVAYQDPSGNIVISYRGTYAPLDASTGWTTGARYLSAQGPAPA